MDFLSQFYLAFTIFSVGITILDLIGVLGQSDDDVDISLPDTSLSNDNLETDLTIVDEIEIDAILPDNPDSSLNSSVLSLLSYLRSLVYFGLGFGPMGVFSWATNNTGLNSLFWSIPSGILATILARVFFRFQKTQTDSTLKPQEILFQQANVTIPVSHDQMGKIRIQIGMNVEEYYALARSTDDSFKKDEVVWITEITNEYVFVERDLLTHTD